MGQIGGDLKQSLRIFQQSPGFAFAAVAALTIGIGANTAIFSVVNTVLLKPLNVPDPDHVVEFMLKFQGGGSSPGGSPQHFFIWREQTALFRNVSAHRLELLNLTNVSDPQQLAAAQVSADFFRLYDAPVLYGRTFSSDEDRAKGGHVAVLSYGFWTDRFAGDPAVLGKRISLNAEQYVVIGVLGPNFNSEQFDQRPAVWIPFQMDPESTDGGCYCRVTGRLNPGIALPTANAQLQVVADQYRRAFPKRLGPKTNFSIEALRDAMVGDVRPILLILLGAVGFVLLIACTNVANLLLVRATGRRREIAIRAAMGASRTQIIRQLLTESVVLSCAGGVLGLALGLSAIRGLLTLFPSNPLLASLNVISIPRIGEQGAGVTLDWRVLAFTALVSVATGLIFGLVPAIPGSHADLNAVLKESSGRSGSGLRHNRTRATLVVAETALALILLVGASLLIRTVIALRAVNPGFDPHNVLIMQMSLAGTRFERTSVVDRIVRSGVEQIHSLPGVVAAAASCCIPLETVWQLSFVIEGRPLNGPFHGFAGWTFISPEYFDAFNIPILRGRGFTDRDDAGSPGVVVINQAMAHRLWPNSDPLHEKLIIGRYVRPEYEKDPAREIVGIVGDVRDVGLNRNPRPAMYVPIAQLPDGINALNLRLLPVAWIVRANREPRALATPVQDRLREGTGLPVARVRTMDEIATQSTARSQLNMLLMTIFGISALLLAAIGIYGVMAYSVQQRTQEIGIRLALGATANDVRNMIILHGMRLAATGVVVGILAALGLVRLLQSLLFGVKAWDPTIFVVVPMLLGTVSLISVWLPACRTTRIDPIDALRYE
jgi:putative ABC transport system permease protein